jgi:hypothetical protein
MTKRDMDEVESLPVGRKVLKVMLHNTMCLADFWGVTIMFDDGSELWIDCRTHDDYLLTAKIVPLGGAG